MILEAENDIFYISDMDTYELYYVNPAGQRMMGLRDYRGRKCYKALQGLDEPCSFCTNPVLKRDNFYIWDRENEYCGGTSCSRIKSSPTRANGCGWRWRWTSPSMRWSAATPRSG